MLIRDNDMAISTSKINNMLIPTVNETINEHFGSYTDEQLKLLLITIAVCSKIRSSDIVFLTEDELRKVHGQDYVSKIEEDAVVIDSFNKSFNDLMFNETHGLDRMLNSFDPKYDNLKSFIHLFATANGHMLIPDYAMEMYDKYSYCFYKQLRSESEEIYHTVNNTVVNVVSMNEDTVEFLEDGCIAVQVRHKTIPIAKLVWGKLLTEYGNTYGTGI